MVAAWKDRGLRGLARRAARVVVEAVAAPDAPLTFVPADAGRRLTRGHHPAEALARELARIWDLPVLPLLERRGGRPQRGLTRVERRANVRGAFTAREQVPRAIVLIDDVYTSGATVNSASSALRKAGARRVDSITFARVVPGYTVRRKARPPPKEDALRLQVKGRNLEISESIRGYAEQKLAKIDRQLGDATRVELELAVEKNPSISANQVAEVTVWTKGPTLRAREASSDMRASIDRLTEKLLRQVTQYRDRRTRRNARNQNSAVDGGAPAMSDQRDQPIVKTKQFAVKPMTAEEAVLQLELVGHDFFVFQNADTETVNVVYRRRDGGYGLIEPQT